VNGAADIVVTVADIRFADSIQYAIESYLIHFTQNGTVPDNLATRTIKRQERVV